MGYLLLFDAFLDKYGILDYFKQTVKQEDKIMFKYTIDSHTRRERLKTPEKRVRAVIDSDAATEIDDHFAISYALCAKDKLDIQAVIAAPFFKATVSSPEEGMTRSYEAIKNLFSLLEEKSDGVVFKGAPHFMPGRNTPVDTEGARKIIELAHRAKDDGEILYIIAIAALTNVASAILLDPSIIDCCTVVWLGGNAVEWHGDNNEYNLRGDLFASQTVFDCGIPLVQFPCQMVTDHLITTGYELETRCQGCGKVGAHLLNHSLSEMKRWGNESRVIWDIITVAFFCVPEAFGSIIRTAPRLNDDKSWDISDNSRPEMRYIYSVNRDIVFRDMYARLRKYAAK